MKLHNVMGTLALLTVCLILKIQYINGDNIDKDAISTGVDVISLGLSFLPPPFGIIMSIFTSTSYQVYNSIKKFENPSEQRFQIIANDVYSKVEKQSYEMKSGLKKLFDELPDSIGGDTTMIDMKKSMKYIKKFSSLKNIKCLTKKCPKKIRRLIVEAMTIRTSEFRIKLKIFMSTYFFSSSKNKENQVLNKTSNIFDIIMKHNQSLRDKNLFCGTDESEQTRILYFVTEILTMLVQSYTIVISAYIREFHKNSVKNISVKDQEDSKKEVINLLHDFRVDVLQFVQESQIILYETSRVIRHCDIKVPIKGKNYERLTRFLEAQLYYFPPMFLSDCEHGNARSNKQIDDDIRMGLTIQESCVYSLDINQAVVDPGDPNRFYHHLAHYVAPQTVFFVFHKPGVYRNYGNPHGNELIVTKYLDTCKMFYCIVDRKNEKSSVRKISLDFISASSNYVITGIRWVVKKNIVQLELQEGLLVNGFVEASTVRILSTPNDTKNYVVLDYKTRGLKLDGLTLPRDYLITGIGMILKNNMITLQAQGTKVNDDQMRLTENTIITSPEFHPNEMIKIKLDDNFPPEVAPSESQFNVRSTTGKNYVEFGPTSFEKDAAQTTIPYFDIRNVFTTPPSPLNSIGIYFAGLKGYGGYVAFNIVSVNLIADLRKEDFIAYFDMVEKRLVNETFNDLT